MNLFRLLADLLHLLSVVIILEKIRRTRNCAGISLKSQELYLIVFCTRYLDLLFSESPWFDSALTMYNSVMKILFLASSGYIVYLMRRKLRATYDSEHDTFRLEFLILPCALVGLLINELHAGETMSWLGVKEILWAFSIYLETVAILPQLFLLSRTNSVENITADYLFCLGLYRAFYLLNWIYRWMTEDEYSQWIVWIPGLIQTLIYGDFFYVYVKSTWYGKPIRFDQLPI